MLHYYITVITSHYYYIILHYIHYYLRYIVQWVMSDLVFRYVL